MKSLKLPVDPQTAELMNLCTAPYGVEVQGFSSFTEGVLNLLEKRYPTISQGILSDCVETTKRACVREIIQAGADKLGEYQDSDPPAPVVMQAGLAAGLEAAVKAVEGK